MPVPIPNLDDRTYEDLVDEALASIPTLYPEWTNHNPSDPGIVTVEMLAWLTEMLLYRINRQTPQTLETFLKLLNGPDWSLDSDREIVQQFDLDGDGKLDPNERRQALVAAQRTTVANLRQRHRAVTCEDFEHLVVEQWKETPINQVLPLMYGIPGETAAKIEESSNAILTSLGIKPTAAIRTLTDEDIDALRNDVRDNNRPIHPNIQHFIGDRIATNLVDALGEKGVVRRAKCIPRRNLSLTQSEGHELLAPGQISLVVVTDDGAPAAGLLIVLWNWLNERRLLTTRHHVVAPVFVEIAVSARLVLVEDALLAEVQSLATETIQAFFDPLKGGTDGTGWPFGRSVYLSEVYDLLDRVKGVDYASEVRIGLLDKKSTAEIQLGDRELVKIAEDNIAFDCVFPT